MAFPLATVLGAAPGLISAAADVLGLIRKRRQQLEQEPASDKFAKIDELNALIEKQALLIEELAVNSQQLTLAVRNNRRLAISALIIAVLAVIVAVLG